MEKCDYQMKEKEFISTKAELEKAAKEYRDNLCMYYEDDNDIEAAFLAGAMKVIEAMQFKCMQISQYIVSPIFRDYGDEDAIKYLAGRTDTVKDMANYLLGLKEDE